MAYRRESPLPIVEGGTSVSTITDHALIVGSGLAAVTEIGPLTNGQLAIGSTGADPVAATITAGAGVAIANGAGTITISATGGGISWTEVTGTSQACAANSGYILNNAALVTATLPATIAVGEVVHIAGKGAGGWRIAQNAGQTIHFGNQDTTTGAGGWLDSTNRYDVVELLCITANTDFLALSAIGNITVT